MRTIHQLANSEYTKVLEKQPAMMLTNQFGSYFSAGLDSRYGGLFLNIQNRVIKILDAIVPIIRKEPSCINRFSNFEYDSIRYFMPNRINGLVCESEGEHEFHFDVKHPYDDSEWGRDYEVSYKDRLALLKFKKENILIAVYGGEFTDCQKWVEKEYSYDCARGSYPCKRYVFCPFVAKGNGFVISAGQDESQLIASVKTIWNRLGELKEERNLYESANTEAEFAYVCAKNSINSLVHRPSITTSPRIYAGLPWFFQVWSRDEGISLGGLLKQNSKIMMYTIKDILLEEMATIQRDGRLPNRFPKTVTGCADGIGWHFVRWEGLLDTATRKGMLYDLFKPEELKTIIHKLELSLQAMKTNYEKDYLIYSRPQESWMDSIPRDGALVEIQAMHLKMHQLMYKLTYDNEYNRVQHRLKAEVRRALFKEGYLWDRISDPLIRPNLFLAAYIYPELLSKEEWEGCFDIVLPKLWLEYGGLSTVSIESRQFHEEYTGQNPDSYHNGDSWFWVSNIAAVVLARVNRAKYSKYISKIKQAGIDDILWNGIAGHSSELSSAKELKSEGSPCQAWSASTLIELLSL
jgi:hypothetical protein